MSRVTGSDVARRAGVSQSAVSLVLNGRSLGHGLSQATHDRVLAAANELEYVPNHAARSLRRRRTNVVTLLTSELGNPYFAEVAAAAGAAALRRNYALHVIAAPTEAAGVDALRRLRAGGTSDGVVMHGGSPGILAEVGRLRAQGMGCVLVQDAGPPVPGSGSGASPGLDLGASGPDGSIPCVRVDLRGGSRLATRHLVALGHRRIAHITDERLPAPRDTTDGDATDRNATERNATGGNDRLAGYRLALDEAGLPFDPALIVPGANSLAGGADAVHALLARPGTRPTALFAFNDQMAVGALHALHAAGLHVPGAMAVVGFDGIELGTYTVPALTTVAHPRRELGQLAAETLLDLLDGTPPAQTVRTLPVRLLIRRSCGAHHHDPAHPGDHGETS